jgi:hypothetical protein
MGKGVHSACWGNRATLGFRERKQFSMCGEGMGVYPSVYFIINFLPHFVEILVV